MCIENCCSFQNHINTTIIGVIVAWYLTLKRKLHPLSDVILLTKSRRSSTDCYTYFLAIFATPPGDGTFQVSAGTDVITLRNRFPYTAGFCLKSVGRREQVSLNPYAVIAPKMPPSGYRLTIFAPNSMSILATRPFRSYIGCVPEMLYM